MVPPVRARSSQGAETLLSEIRAERVGPEVDALFSGGADAGDGPTSRRVSRLTRAVWARRSVVASVPLEAHDRPRPEAASRSPLPVGWRMP